MTEFGTEVRPLHEKWVLDAEVAKVPWDEPPRSCHVPSLTKSILLSNIPNDVKEETLRASLCNCGDIVKVDICNEWKAMEDTWRDRPETIKTKDGLELPMAPPKYTMSYAFVEFSDAASRQRATRKLPRLSGILFKEVLPIKLTKWSSRPVGRPCYPQDVRLKRSLVLRSLPMHMEPLEVLQAILERLHKPFAASGNVARAQLLNCGSFWVKGVGPLQQLDVEVGDNGVEISQEPKPNLEAGRDVSANHCREGNGGAMVLRFPSFQDAYIARRHLQELHLAGQRVFCGFPPWRPQVVWTSWGARGRDGEARLVDMPLPRASARYRHGCNPVESAPTQEEVEKMAMSEE